MVVQSLGICNTEIRNYTFASKLTTLRWCYHTQKFFRFNRVQAPLLSLAEIPLFPSIDPFRSDLLNVGGDHEIYYEECGNPHGYPVLVIHGGPGSGCTPFQRRFFDPVHYRIILFDQRGCGRSTPQGCIENNTTHNLVSDIELLRKKLCIDQWLLFGGSWGSTLALAYASSYPDHVQGMILRGIFLARPSELNWFLYEVKQIFPEAWKKLVAPLSTEELSDVLASYVNRVFSDNYFSSVAAAQNWNDFERAIIALLPLAENSHTPDNQVTLARARVQLHYLMNDCFLREHPLLDRVDRFRHIPSIIIHGRYDMVCPIITAHTLHQCWPEAEFEVIPDAGHAGAEPGIARALLMATERFKSLN